MYLPNGKRRKAAGNKPGLGSLITPLFPMDSSSGGLVVLTPDCIGHGKKSFTQTLLVPLEIHVNLRFSAEIVMFQAAHDFHYLFNNRNSRAGVLSAV